MYVKDASQPGTRVSEISCMLGLLTGFDIAPCGLLRYLYQDCVSALRCHDITRSPKLVDMNVGIRGKRGME